jgi:hypothetical protein
VIDVRDAWALDAPLALDDQVITFHPDCCFLGNQPGDFSADNEMILGLENLDRRTPGGDAFLPLSHESLRNVKRDLNVNC